MIEQEWMKKLQDEGVKDLTIVTMEPGVKGEHTHDESTIHVILQGKLTIKDSTGEKIYHPGDYIEFPAGTKHSVIFGSQGLSMIVGTK